MTTSNRNILVSFGRSDPFNLSWHALAHIGKDKWPQCTVVEGPNFHVHEWPSEVEVYKNPNTVTMRTLMGIHEELYCGTGATMLEGIAAGLLVWVLNKEMGFSLALLWNSDYYLDHSLKPCASWQGMVAEIRQRRQSECK